MKIMRIKEYFTDKELQCPCCKVLKIEEDFLEMLYIARIKANKKFIITSGYRCDKHNLAVGSIYPNHPAGRAVDISCNSAYDRQVIINSLIYAGFKRIGISDKFIHVDNMNLSSGIWLY